MFCPKCSQQQISDETRFCSRCGFELGVVKALLASDDLPGMHSTATQPPDRSLRKRDLTIGALFMFLAALVVAAITVDMPPSHSGRILALIVVWMALSLLINIVPLLRYFLKGDVSSPTTTSNASSSKLVPGLFTQSTPSAQNPALPPTQSLPVTNFVGGQRVTTAEVTRPPSVTEQTTNLLNNE